MYRILLKYLAPPKYFAVILMHGDSFLFKKIFMYNKSHFFDA